jgi:hypothetical protein
MQQKKVSGIVKLYENSFQNLILTVEHHASSNQAVVSKSYDGQEYESCRKHCFAPTRAEA